MDDNNVMLILNQLLEGQKYINKRLDGIDARLDGIDARLDGIDARLDAMDARLDGIDARLDAMDARLDGIDARLDAMDARFDGIDARLDRIENKLDAVVEQTANLTEFMTEMKDFRDKTSNDIEEIKENMTTVEVITASNWRDIAKLKAVR